MRLLWAHGVSWHYRVVLALKPLHHVEKTYDVHDDSAADALDNAMKAGRANWELKLYEFLKTDQAERYLKH